jgi:hypothetical protein
LGVLCGAYLTIFFKKIEGKKEEKKRERVMRKVTKEIPTKCQAVIVLAN